MATKKQDLAEQPTRDGIKQLFRDLFSELARHSDDEHPLRQAYLKYDEIYDKASDDALKSPKLKRLERTRDAAQKKWEDYRAARLAKVRAVHRLFLAKGLTPDVHRKIKALVE